MEGKIYLIYKDSMDDYATIVGYIQGTEEEADKYCEKYNAKAEYEFEEIWYEELKNLLES